MKWLPGGWQRADQERRTVPRRTAQYPVHQDPVHQDPGHQDPAHQYPDRSSATRVFSDADRPEPHGRTALSARTRDVDVSASSFRMLLVGGGISGFLTVMCAAILVANGNSAGMWLWQLISGVVFLWFATASRGMLSSRGFLVDASGFYARTQGEVVGVPWGEIKAIGVGTLPWVQNRRPVNPERRHALEFYPSDPGFAARHPEFDRWRIDEPAPIAGLPATRYRFHLPPFTRLPRSLGQAVQTVAAQKWIGGYQRELPTVADQ